jgi:RNA polymerase sigma-70 factor (ECF subfamily)
MFRRLARSKHDVEDAFQETAMRVWKYLDRAPRVRNWRGWLMTIGYRAFLDLKSSRPKPSTLAADQELPYRGQLTPAQVAERSESAEQVNAMVAELPEKLRDVVVLHYTGGLTLRQTARAVGVPIGTVKSRLSQALVALRRRLS